MSSRVLITGASGFVGRAVCREMDGRGTMVRASLRKHDVGLPVRIEQQVVGDLSEKLNWQKVLNGIDIVIHAAARVHIMHDQPKVLINEFRKINTVATLNLAHQAIVAGVKRFIFLSSIKVNGEKTDTGLPFTPEDNHIPDDPYGLSKYEAEQGLLDLAKNSGMEVVIIRPPLVYGPNVRANFASMMKWMNRSVPLPLGAIYNQRSLIALDNLVDFIALCADRKNSPQAKNQIFLISDGEDVSTTLLLRKVAKSLNKRAWLVPVSVSLMAWGVKLFGKENVANRLFGSLQVDSSKARDLLGWQPVTTMDEQLKKTADTFLNGLNRTGK